MNQATRAEGGLMEPESILSEEAVYANDYRCDLCNGPGALPTTEHMDDPPGFTLYDQPAVCSACAAKWSESTREYRRRVRQWLGSEPDEDGVA